MPGVTNVIDVFKQYNGDNWFLLLFAAALLYLLWRAEKELRKNILLMTAAAVILIFNNITFKVAARIMGSDTYYRFIWIIPVVPILGYVIIDIFIRCRKKLIRAAVLLVSCFIIWAGGTSCLDSESFHWPNHILYFNPVATQINDMIMEDAGQDSFPRVAVDVNLAPSIRLAGSHIVCYIEREIYRLEEGQKARTRALRRQKFMNRLVNGEHIGKKAARTIIACGNLDYIVIATAYDMDHYMSKLKCTVLGTASGYTIYKCPKDN